MGDTSRHNKKRARSLKVADRNREWYMEWLRGKSAQQIADQFAAKLTTVKSGLVYARKERIATQQATIEEEVQESRDQLDTIIREAMEAWQKSKENSEKVTTTKSKDGTTESITVEGQCGDPRFLEKALNAIEKKARLLGLNAPDKQEMTGVVGVAGHITVEVQESEDWYGIRHHPHTIEANHQPADGDASSGGNPDESRPVQGGDVRPAVGQNGSGLNGHHQGPRESPPDVPGGS